MAATATKTLMTTEEMLALPDDGVERWLIRGQLREKPLTVRNREHSRIMAVLCQLLGVWRDAQPRPRGDVLGGEAGCKLRRNPDTTVGIDVVYVGPELAAQQSEDTTLIDGVPVLAVEILSPSDTLEEIDDKVDTYLSAGVHLVWVVDPHDRTVLVYQPGAATQLFNDTQELSGDPHLPGFRTPVTRLFER
jgi:Uma2 family endonuclease